MIDQDPTIAGYRILKRPSAGGASNIDFEAAVETLKDIEDRLP